MINNKIARGEYVLEPNDIISVQNKLFIFRKLESRPNFGPSTLPHKTKEQENKFNHSLQKLNNREGIFEEINFLDLSRKNSDVYETMWRESARPFERVPPANDMNNESQKQAPKHNNRSPSKINIMSNELLGFDLFNEVKKVRKNIIAELISSDQLTISNDASDSTFGYIMTQAGQQMEELQFISINEMELEHMAIPVEGENSPMELEDISDDELNSPTVTQEKNKADTPANENVEFINFRNITQTKTMYKKIPFTSIEERPIDLTKKALENPNYQSEPINLTCERSERPAFRKPINDPEKIIELAASVEIDNENPLDLSDKTLIYHPENVERMVRDILDELENNELLDLSRTILVMTQTRPATPIPTKPTLKVTPRRRLIREQGNAADQSPEPQPGPSWRRTSPQTNRRRRSSPMHTGQTPPPIYISSSESSSDSESDADY